MARLRLVFVSHSLPPEAQPDSNIGGMQRVALELHEAFSRRDDIDYLPLVMRSTWSDTHRRVGPFLIRTLFTLRKLIRGKSVDVVLYSSMVSAALDTLLSRSRSRNRVASAAIVHGLDVTTDAKLYQRFVPRVFAALDLVAPVSRATGDACIVRGLDSSRCIPIPNGVDVTRFSFPSANDFAKRPANRPSLQLLRGYVDGTVFEQASLVLCSVGRHVERKGFAWFVENVLPRLPEDVLYVVVGEGPETDHIKQVAATAGVAARLVLPGRVGEDELRRLYAGADLFVMPNVPVPGDMEGFGVVMLEAGLSGAPAIAAGIEGILDVIEDGQNGTLVPSGDVAAFASAIMRYYNDHEAVVESAKRARQYTADTFGWDAIAERYVATLESLRSSRSLAPGLNPRDERR